MKAFLGGSSVVVSAPTSSGKTLIAEAAAIATIARGRRLFYTTPLKALSNQKFREFRCAGFINLLVIEMLKVFLNLIKFSHSSSKDGLISIIELFHFVM